MARYVFFCDKKFHLLRGKLRSLLLETLFSSDGEAGAEEGGDGEVPEGGEKQDGDEGYQEHEEEEDDPPSSLLESDSSSAGLSLLLDPAARSRWTECGLPDAHDFYDDVLPWEWGRAWPFVWDPEGLGLRAAERAHTGAGRRVRCLQAEHGLDLGAVREALGRGEVLVLCGVRRFDSAIKPLLTKRIVRKGGENGMEAFVEVGGELCPYNESFRLLIVSSSAGPKLSSPPSSSSYFSSFDVDQEFVSYCSFTDFSATDLALRERFLGTLFERESPRGAADLEKTSRRANANSARRREKEEEGVLRALSGAEGNLLGQRELVDGLLAAKEEAGRMEEAGEPLEAAVRAQTEARAGYGRAADHAVSLYRVRE